MQRNCLLYIDPGTGSMLFSVLLGIFMAALFAFRKAWIKIKSLVLGGRVEKINKDKIPVVIFTDSKRYWTIFHPICDELDRRGIRTEYWTESEDDPAFGSEKDYKNITCRYIGNLNKAITKLNIINAYICLSTTPGSLSVEKVEEHGSLHSHLAFGKQRAPLQDVRYRLVRCTDAAG